MIGKADLAFQGLVEIKVKDAQPQASFSVSLQRKHLVEVTVVDAAIVIHTDQASTHDLLGSGWIEARRESFHVCFVLPGMLQM